MAQFRSLSIRQIQRQTDKAVHIIFDVPSELDSEFKFKAGQYLTLETQIDGEEVRRSYSISTETGKDLGVVIKAIPEGKFSNFANSSLKEGDSLEVHPPEGKFILPDAKDNKTFVAFAAGSGITPNLAMIKTLLKIICIEAMSYRSLETVIDLYKFTPCFNNTISYHHGYAMECHKYHQHFSNYVRCNL